jgi:PTS system ascorbate-specific IIA component
VEEIIIRENIRIERQKAKWQEAIKIAGNLLLKNGSITESYINEMIHTVLEFGPYIVIAPGMAIAHAAPSASVFRDDISLVVFKDPVYFDSQNDPVKLLFAFSASKKEQHLEQLVKLSTLLSEEETVQALEESNTEEEVYKLVNSLVM